MTGDENLPNNQSATASSPLPMEQSPSPNSKPTRKHRNSSFLHRFRLRKDSKKDKGLKRLIRASPSKGYKELNDSHTSPSNDEHSSSNNNNILQEIFVDKISNKKRKSDESLTDASKDSVPIDTFQIDSNRTSMSTLGSPSLDHLKEEMRLSQELSMSHSPVSMEPGALSALYFHEEDDEHCDDVAENVSCNYSIKFDPVGDRKRGSVNSEDHDNDELEIEQDEDEDISDLDEDCDDDDDENDVSDDSTVVNALPPARPQQPPPGASKEEKDRFYWDLCYGHERKKPPVSSMSASKQAPVKSCMSARKTPWTKIAQSASKRLEMRRQQQVVLTPSNSDSKEMDTSNHSMEKKPNVTFVVGTPRYSTPQGLETSQKSSTDRKVKFGSSKKAEFEASEPPSAIKPLSQEFHLKEQLDSSDDESMEMHQETARNGDMLAQWDDDFDSICENDDWNGNNSIISMDGDSDDDAPLAPLVERKNKARRSTGRMSNHGSGRRGSRRNSRPGSSDRRSSTFYSKNGGSLLDPEETCDKDDTAQVLESSNSANRESDGYKRSSTISKDSLQFSSPSTFGESFRLSSESETSKVTPNSDMNSSSNLLRSVHSEGGASLTHSPDDESRTDLKPSQLDYVSSVSNEYNSPTIHYSSPEASESDVKSCCTLQVPFNSLSLQEAKIDFQQQHKVNSLLATNEVLSTALPSFVEIVKDIDENIADSLTNCLGQENISAVLQAAVDMIEEEVSDENDYSDSFELHSIIESLLTTLDKNEVEEVYSLLAQDAFKSWLIKDIEVADEIVNWLMSLQTSNMDSEKSIGKILLSVQASPSKQIRKERESMTVNEKSIRKLNDLICTESANLERMKNQVLFLDAVCELELCQSCDLSHCHLLQSLVTYQCKIEQQQSMSILYSNPNEMQLSVSWKQSQKDTESSDRRESMSSISSTDTNAALFMNSPILKRKKCKERPFENSLARKSIERRLYCFFLDSQYLDQILTEQFKIEHELAILTVSDIFGRLEMLAKDVMIIQKYYKCKFETRMASTAILAVTITLGSACAIVLKFSYDLSKPTIFLHPVPSDIYIESLVGEPSKPAKTLQKMAKDMIEKNAKNSNFLLTTICSTIVDTLTRF